GHVGYVNLNTIVNAAGIWPLEFTCRFGYPGFAVLAPLQGIGWGDLLHIIGSRSGHCFHVNRGYSVGVVLTTPPFPYSRKQVTEPVGLPLMLPERFDREDMRHIHFGEVGRVGDQWITSGLYGWTCVVTGTGPGVGDAQRDAYARIADIIVPNGRYRLDIGDRLVGGDLAVVEALGLLAV